LVIKKKNKDHKDTGNLQILLHLRSQFQLHGIAFASYWASCSIYLKQQQQNKDLKCNRILQVTNIFILFGYFLWSLFFFFKLSIFTLSSFLVFMSSYGLIVMILGFCISGSTAAVHTGDVGSSPTWNIFSFLMNIALSD